MGKKTWIDSDIWTDTEDLTVQERLLYLCLLTNNQRNIAGYYKLNIDHLSLDVGLAKQKIESMLIRQKKYWIYDKETRQVLIPKFTKHNTVKSSPQVIKLNAELRTLKPCPLHKEFLKAFTECNGIGAETVLDAKFVEIAKSY